VTVRVLVVDDERDIEALFPAAVPARVASRALRA
jgi:hypothetical protein